LKGRAVMHGLFLCLTCKSMCKKNSHRSALLEPSDVRVVDSLQGGRY
jgi:hypothetical protein